VGIRRRFSGLFSVWFEMSPERLQWTATRAIIGSRQGMLVIVCGAPRNLTGI
jgi:hypothetical protein